MSPHARPTRTHSHGTPSHPATLRARLHPRMATPSPKRLQQQASRPQTAIQPGQHRPPSRHVLRRADARRLRPRGRSAPRPTKGVQRSHRRRPVRSRCSAGRRLPPPQGRIRRSRLRRDRRHARFPRRSAPSSFPVTRYERPCRAARHRRPRRRDGRRRVAPSDPAGSSPARRRDGPRVGRNSRRQNRVGRARRNGTGTRLEGSAAAQSCAASRFRPRS